MNGVLTAVTAADFKIPTVDYAAISPVLIVAAAAVVGVLVEAFAPRAARRPVQLILVFGSLIAAFVEVVLHAGVRSLEGVAAIALDGPGLVLQGALVLVAIVGAMLIAERQVDPAGDAFAARASTLPGSQDERQFSQRGYLQTEIWPLFLFSVSGMLLFPVSNDLLLMFVALEVMSLPLYLLVGMARRRRLLSQEAALKYFILGAFSSAFFLFGSALLYGFSGSINFSAIAEAMAGNPQQSVLLLVGMGMIAVGLLFKIGAAPFHQWAPDVYQGAPTPVTAFMAAAVKIAAFGAILRIFYVVFGGLRWDWQPMLWVIAILTMLIGAIVAVTQTDVKRMLAYSSIAQAGFILLGVVAASPQGLAASIFYLIAYAFTTLGTFAVVMLVRDATGEATHLSKWAGLGRKSPVLATVFAIFMLSLAGIPLTSGFVGKFAVFSAAIAAGATPLVIVALVASLIAAFVYGRVIVVMFFADPPAEGPTVVVPSVFTTLALTISVAVTVVLGIVPGPLLDLLAQAGVFIR